MNPTTLNRTRRVGGTALAAAALAAALSACAPLIVGGAVVGGVMAVDRRTAGTQIEDEGIELRAANRIREALTKGASCHLDPWRVTCLGVTRRCRAPLAKRTKIVCSERSPAQMQHCVLEN